MKKVVIVLLVGLFLLVISGLIQAAGTKEEAVALVEKAAAFYKANGKEKTLAEVNKPKGPFVKGDLYVFIYDLKATILAHPTSPKLIGKNLYEMTDFDKKYFRKEIVSVATTKGSGWVDYTYKNPENNKIEPKTTYVLKVADMIFCCGVYR
jgi:signal transduction histidine kinase